VSQTAASFTITPANAAKPITVDFNGGRLTADAGALILQQVEQKIRLVEQINARIRDTRDQLHITHLQSHLLQQRILAIALGYEDVNDHKELRKDPALLVGIKGSPEEESPLGSAPTLSRLENRITGKEVTEATKLFVELFIKSFDEPPKNLILDFDATNDTIHGNQEGKYFNGFYDEH
jgi:hypothetical protein